MIDGLKTSEHAQSAIISAEMLLANILKWREYMNAYCKHEAYQNGRSKIKLVKKLRDEYMNFEYSVRIQRFHIFQNFDEPLKVFVCRTNPQKIHFFAFDSAMSAGCFFEHHVH